MDTKICRDSLPSVITSSARSALCENDSLMPSFSFSSSFLRQYEQANSHRNVMFLLDRHNLQKSHHYPMVVMTGQGDESGADKFHDWSKCENGDVRDLARISLEAGRGDGRGRLLGKGFWKPNSTSGERSQVLFEEFNQQDALLMPFAFDATLGS
jgi:hypothetical protein